jgi:thiol:disulfide interchange protein
MINKHIVIIGLAATLLLAGDKDVFSKYNLDEALSAAETQSKSVMVKFHADWCHFCKKMDRVTFTDKNVQKALNDYIPVKVDVDTKEGLNFAKQYGITELPTIIMFDKNGKKRYHQPGFHSAKHMEQILKNGLN